MMKKQNTPLCTTGMHCTVGCPCAGKDGICHCPMIDDQKCACNGHCVVPKSK